MGSDFRTVMNTICSPSLPLAPSPETQNRAAAALPLPWLSLLIGIGAVSFHLAFPSPLLSPLILIYLACLVELPRAHSRRVAFYSGLLLGLLIFVPKLGFFYTIFSLAALPLW